MVTRCSEASGGRKGAGLDADALACLAFVGEPHLAVGGGEQRVILAHSDVLAGVEGAAALSDDDRPRKDELSVAALDAEALAGAVASVLAGRAGLLVCHRLLLGLRVGRL